jgi:integrase
VETKNLIRLALQVRQLLLSRSPLGRGSMTPPSAWCWIGPRQSVTRPSTKRCSVQRCSERPALAGTTCLPPGLKVHALRHTYASLCVAAGIPPLQLSRFMGHAKVTTTLSIYTHLFDDDHAETMAALDAMSPPVDAPNVVQIRRRI